MAKTKSSRAWVWSMAAIALAVVAGYLTYRLQPSAPPAEPVIATTVPTSRPATIARVVSEARQLKLITWSFETALDAQSVSDKWYGDAIAEARAPVRYQYGVDLQTLDDGSVFRDSATGALTFIISPPQRLAVEVDVERLEQSLKTSGLRSRSRNQTQLDATVKELGAAANHLKLSPRDEQRMREASRQQIETHLQRVLARLEPGIPINVKFAE